MPNRQYYCWKLCLKFHCGCTSYTSTQHVCNSNRGVQCHKWMITRTTDKDCDNHRIVGLHDPVEPQAKTSRENQQGEAEQPCQVQDEGGYLVSSGSWEQGPRRRAAA